MKIFYPVLLMVIFSQLNAQTEVQLHMEIRDPAMMMNCGDIPDVNLDLNWYGIIEVEGKESVYEIVSVTLQVEDSPGPERRISTKLRQESKYLLGCSAPIDSKKIYNLSPEHIFFNNKSRCFYPGQYINSVTITSMGPEK